jgi:hypothetical protein
MSKKRPITPGQLPHHDEIVEVIQIFASERGLEASPSDRDIFACHLAQPPAIREKVRSVQVTGFMENGQSGLIFIPSYTVMLPFAGENHEGEIDMPRQVPDKYISQMLIADLTKNDRLDRSALTEALENSWSNSLRLTRDDQVESRVSAMPEATRGILAQRNLIPAIEALAFFTAQK